jgi:HD superfamily phosphohydrolase
MVEARARRPRIFDAVYGYVELDKHEFRLVNTAIFQRLHWIKQLGPLHTVFPSAQHSRFSHTIGVFYIAKKMIEHLKSLPEYGYKFANGEDRILKFAALLHDIGHVPLSHVGERVLERDMEARAKEEDDKEPSIIAGLDLLRMKPRAKAWHRLFPDENLLCSGTKLHERLSAEIALHDREIDKVLARVWPSTTKREECKRRIAQAIVGMDLSDIPTVLLHSELDADRLDYLLRDSFFTGVGYGQVDLDYIISRLAIWRKNPLESPVLCIEHKGLHTIEHYIFGRFFLQTQVIYNRKVRFLDLLFEDVMSYMLTTESDDCRLMNLGEFYSCIHNAKGKDKRSYLHRMYSYTDAEVFARMRKLHEHLDGKEKDGTADARELYINDCIKTIMDGDVPDPVFHTCHILVDRRRHKNYEGKLVKKARRKAERIAAELDIYPSRIKTNFISQEVMKYARRFIHGGAGREPNRSIVKTGTEEEANREAVRVMFRTPTGEDRLRYAAECNGTVLRDLTDKALLLFNCYYVRPKGRVDACRRAEAKIKEAFAEFIDGTFYR